MINYYLQMFTRWSDFSGRSSRSEYWWPFAINVIVGSLISSTYSIKDASFISLGTSGLYSLIILIPAIALTIRRLHDTDRSGVNILWLLLPFIGWIVLLFMLIGDSTPGSNKYGSNPKN